MISLNHAIWEDAPDAMGDCDVGERLASLCEQWDDDDAQSLFWDCLCHQDTLYPVTFLAVPHLLAYHGEASRVAQEDIAHFLGSVVLNNARSRDAGDCSVTTLGIEGWPDDPIWEHVRSEFKNSIPLIADLCRQNYLSSTPGLEDNERLAACMAAMGHQELAEHLEHDQNGGFACTQCGIQHEWFLFPDCLGVYLAGDGSIVGPSSGDQQKLLKDADAGQPDNARSVAMPVDLAHPAVEAAKALLAERSSHHAARLVSVWGTILTCAACGFQQPLR